MRTNVFHRIGLLSCGIVLVTLATRLPSSATAGSSDDGIVLINPLEARELRLNNREWRQVPEARGLPIGPEIIIRRPPVVAGDVPTIRATSPTDLDVIFEPREAPVSMDTLKVEVRKGFFARSLTQLLRPYISGDSIKLSQVEIPAGRFLLDISIADTSGNITDASYLLEVGRR